MRVDRSKPLDISREDQEGLRVGMPIDLDGADRADLEHFARSYQKDAERDVLDATIDVARALLVARVPVQDAEDFLRTLERATGLFEAVESEDKLVRSARHRAACELDQQADQCKKAAESWWGTKAAPKRPPAPPSTPWEHPNW